MPGFGFGKIRGQHRAIGRKTGAQPTPAPAPTTSETSVARNNATFTFAAARDVGQYADGSYFAVIPDGGDITLASTTPASQLVSGNYSDIGDFTDKMMHGLMVDPGEGEGWTTAAQGFHDFENADTPASLSTLQPVDTALNLDPGFTAAPLAVTAPSTLMKAVHNMTPPSNLRFGLTENYAALTCVSAVPPENAFRPAPAAGDKTSYFTADDVDLAFLPSLAAPASQPDFATLTARIDKVYQTWFTNNLFSRELSAVNHQELYGRDIAEELGEALLALCTDALTAAEKETLARHLVQIGLDILGNVTNGGSWAILAGWGGGQHWVKAVAIFAAHALRNAADTAKAAELLALVDPAQNDGWATEDNIFTYVDRAYIEAASDQRSGFDHIAFNHYMENAPLWRSDVRSPTLTGSAWNHVYRLNVLSTTLPQALALRMMGLATASFVTGAYNDYLDFGYDWALGESWGADLPSPFVLDMLASFWGNYGAGADAAAPSIVRVAARESEVWIEFDKLLSRGAIPSRGAFAVSINGSPATILAEADSFVDEPSEHRSPNVYGYSLAVRLAAPVAQGDTVTIAYTPPGTDAAMTIGGAPVATIAETVATNLTGVLPAPAAQIETVRDTALRSERQVSSAPPFGSETIAWLQFSYRFRLYNLSGGDALISTNAASSSRFWFYSPSGTSFRFYPSGVSSDRVDFAGANTNLPLDGTEITMHVQLDYSATDEAGMVKLHFAWDRGSWTPAAASSARAANMPNLNALFGTAGGLALGGHSGNTTGSADIAHNAFIMRWGTGAAPNAPDFADADFAHNADWGDNGENVWGQPQLYFAGMLTEWNGSLPNRGNFGVHPLQPSRLDAEGEPTSSYMVVTP